MIPLPDPPRPAGSPRPPAVAGSFYPASAATLANDVHALLAQAAVDPRQAPLKAIIAPHAGYIYSGQTAAAVYACLAAQRRTIRRVILLGPSHRVALHGMALPGANAFVTPLGSIPLDTAGMASLAPLPQIVRSDAAHAQEHSLEVQLPFLQSVLDAFTLLPLAVGSTPAASVAAALDRLWGGPETLIVVSSDLSHYLPYAVARQTDGATAQRILALDPELDHAAACGATPINGLLLAARQHGLHVRLLDLRNSGDTAGDKLRVVGYGAFAFYEPPHAH